jgi:hypothetical protein
MPTLCIHNFDALVCFFLVLAVTAEFFFRGAYLIFHLLTLKILSKFHYFPLLLHGKNAQAILNYSQPKYRKQTNIGRKSNGLCNVHISKNFPKCYFFVAHPMIFKNEKKIPVLMTFKLVLECKS